MLRFLFSGGAICTWCLVCVGVGFNPAQAWEQPATPTVTQPQGSVTSPDEAAIREAGKAFAAAFNANDAKAIAAQWVEDGVFVDESGERIEGREAIQKQYETFFAEYPGVQIVVQVDNVKMVTPTTVIIEGTTTLGEPDNKSPVSSQFLAVRIKSNGKWLLASAHDMRTVVEEQVGNLADLEALIGVWQYKNEQTVYQTNCRWIEGKKFVERKFTVSENGKVTSSGTQVIGLDPLTKQITSWLFDSTGAHDVAVWTNYENGWMVESNGATADGIPTSAVNLLKHVDENSIAFKSVNRMAGGEKVADTEKIVLQRVSQTESGR